MADSPTFDLSAFDFASLDLSTKSGRRSYLRTMLERLCANGPRPAGSTAYDRAAALIAEEMNRALLSVSLEPFAFTGWELIGEAMLRCGSRDLETLPDYGSRGTPPEGTEGRVERVDDESYQLVTPNGPEARMFLSPFGRATPFSTVFRDDRSLPIFNLGRQDRCLIEEAVKYEIPVRAVMQTVSIPRQSSISVAGTLEGISQKEILIMAHADTQYNSPGAHDNTATVIVLLMLAHALGNNRPAHTLTFIATGGEEIGLLGARQYARARKRRNDLDRIQICLNMDSLSYGPDFVVTSHEETLKALFIESFAATTAAGKPRFESSGPVWDAQPFAAAGARTVYINSRGYDAQTLPLWHRPEDLPAAVRPELIESAFQRLMYYIQNLPLN